MHGSFLSGKPIGSVFLRSAAHDPAARAFFQQLYSRAPSARTPNSMHKLSNPQLWRFLIRRIALPPQCGMRITKLIRISCFLRTKEVLVGIKNKLARYCLLPLFVLRLLLLVTVVSKTNTTGRQTILAVPAIILVLFVLSSVNVVASATSIASFVRVTLPRVLS